MASMMAIWSAVFGSCVEGIFVSVEIESRGAWLCCGWKHLKLIFGGESGSSLAVNVGDGARYWRAFCALLASLKN